MRQTTKETVEWIKNVLKSNEPSYSAGNGYVINEMSAIRLLDKLTLLETRLSRGGVIRDCHGKLCVDGDRICTENNKGEELSATLVWNPDFRRFDFRWDSSSERLGGRLFEKIYEEENK